VPDVPPVLVEDPVAPVPAAPEVPLAPDPVEPVPAVPDIAPLGRVVDDELKPAAVSDDPPAVPAAPEPAIPDDPPLSRPEAVPALSLLVAPELAPAPPELPLRVPVPVPVVPVELEPVPLSHPTNATPPTASAAAAIQ
jgi:hypothetical protein